MDYSYGWIWIDGVKNVFPLIMMSVIYPAINIHADKDEDGNAKRDWKKIAIPAITYHLIGVVHMRDSVGVIQLI